MYYAYMSTYYCYITFYEFMFIVSFKRNSSINETKMLTNVNKTLLHYFLFTNNTTEQNNCILEIPRPMLILHFFCDFK